MHAICLPEKGGHIKSRVSIKRKNIDVLEGAKSLLEMHGAPTDRVGPEASRGATGLGKRSIALQEGEKNPTGKRRIRKQTNKQQKKWSYPGATLEAIQEAAKMEEDKKQWRKSR